MQSSIVNLIIGRESNLSRVLQQQGEFTLLSSREILSDINILSEFKTKRISVIFNNFQPSTELGNIESYSDYIQSAILATSRVLDYFSKEQIVKIIYTSSSSVYGDNSLCKESDDVNIMSLHPALKFSNEKMIENYCTTYSIDYTIVRVFNMYGGEDKFSIISKILDAYTHNKVLTIVNGGSAIRDFIHIDNVVEVYMKLLEKKEIPLLNIGSGRGSSVEKILSFLKLKGIEIKTNNISRSEIKLSTADVSLLKSVVDVDSFLEVETYLTEELDL